MNIKEALAKWDAGEPVRSIEMGGMGSGYEQAIQICIFAIIRDWLAKEQAPSLATLLPPRKGGYPEMTEAQGAAWSQYTATAKAATIRVDSDLRLGLSGAQAGAAQNAAFNFIASPSWEVALASVPADRVIEVKKAALRTMTPKEAFGEGRRRGHAAKEGA